jgi:hypothetical protein
MKPLRGGPDVLLFLVVVAIIVKLGTTGLPTWLSSYA